MNTILELSDGQRLEVALTSKFNPENVAITVLVKNKKETQKFFLSEICCIMFDDMQEVIPEDDTDLVHELVTTTTGKTYHLRVSTKQSYSTGFFAQPAKPNDFCRLLFFPTIGVRTRCQKRAVGEILQAEGVVSFDHVQNALKEQKRLRKRLTGEIISDHVNLPHAVIETAIEQAKKTPAAGGRAKIGEILIAAGLINQEQLKEALTIKEKNNNKKIGEILVELGYVSENNILSALASKFRLQMVDMSTLAPHMKAIEALPNDVVQRLNVFPVMDKGDALVVATSQPTDPCIEEALRFFTGRKIQMVVAPSKQISEAIQKHYSQGALPAGVDELLVEMTTDQSVEYEEENETPTLSESDSQVVNIVNRILMDAYSKGASDIHFEPGLRDQPSCVRYRVDGICRVVHQIPTNFTKAIISRIKILANLDIAERRRPQSGKIFLKFHSNKVDYRVEITPVTGNNESAVLRILSASKPLPLDRMGFSAPNLKAFRSVLSQPYGIILCVGPTGSGKTTTLHSALSHLNTPERKIWTAEDPVEITQAGLQQVQINAKIGLSFADVLRSFLRADPDVIMIGEMRDHETAKTAIEASLTGHLVLSTLHTNNAPETIVRLIEMGMDPFNFAESLLAILAQRLARKLCEKCKRPYHPNQDEFMELMNLYSPSFFKEHQLPSYSPGMRFMKIEGCENCSGAGYRGRVALHELAVGTEKIKGAIKAKAPVDQLRTVALQDGMRVLLMDGIQKIFQGLTDLPQVLRVCSSQTLSGV